MDDFDSEELFMAELKNDFFDKVSVNMKKLLILFERKDFDEIKKIAHDIKGTSGIFNMMRGSELGKELQDATDKKDSQRVKTLIDELIEYMKNEGVKIQS